jgi:tetratricopeptide (TPR) repeat protein
VIALALAILLAGAPAAKPAAPAAKPASAEAAKPGGAPAATPAVGPAADAPAADAPEAAPAAEKLDGDVMDFLTPGRSTAARDGGVKLPWNGPGGVQLSLSWDALDKRNDALTNGDMMARALAETIRKFYDTEGGLDPSAMKAKLRSMVGAPLDEARASYLEAVSLEERRLFFVERALAQADAAGDPIPGIEPQLVARRAAAIRSGAVKAALAAQLDAYRDLALGLVAFLEGDNFGALQKVRGAAVALPDFALAHAFLGSMYFLFDQREAAVVAWRRAYELDPSNQAQAAAQEVT